MQYMHWLHHTGHSNHKAASGGQPIQRECRFSEVDWVVEKNYYSESLLKLMHYVAMLLLGCICVIESDTVYRKRTSGGINTIRHFSLGYSSCWNIFKISYVATNPKLRCVHRLLQAQPLLAMRNHVSSENHFSSHPFTHQGDSPTTNLPSTRKPQKTILPRPIRPTLKPLRMENMRRQASQPLRPTRMTECLDMIHPSLDSLHGMVGTCVLRSFIRDDGLCLIFCWGIFSAADSWIGVGSAVHDGFVMDFD
ncbi:hypothetical protein BJ878DRAFT_236572 [Calycina marina]|uniref:Uncharacterized protein n=1 Tax=Calycina marina TaxID=1763456 RepID=A0A9P7ZB94_9HELO|nr:hypothetical protein BJ878DRAFT_236572 [Calycina marina]